MPIGGGDFQHLEKKKPETSAESLGSNCHLAYGRWPTDSQSVRPVDRQSNLVDYFFTARSIFWRSPALTSNTNGVVDELV